MATRTLGKVSAVPNDLMPRLFGNDSLSAARDPILGGQKTAASRGGVSEHAIHLIVFIYLFISTYIAAVYTPFTIFLVLIIFFSFQGLTSMGFHKQCHCKHFYLIFCKRKLLLSSEHKDKTKIINIQNLEYDRIAHSPYHFLIKFWIL